MFCYCEGLAAALGAVLAATLVLSRSPALACALTGGLYVALRLLSLEPAAPQRAQQVVQPRRSPARIAHRGGGHDAPENTLAAIRQAAENGATGVELDLEFTADGVPILMHDETVDRTTNGSGSLHDLTFAEVRKFNPAAKHRLWRDYHGEKIPTLREAVLESMHYNLIIYFDVKGHADQVQLADKMLISHLLVEKYTLAYYARPLKQQYGERGGGRCEANRLRTGRNATAAKPRVSDYAHGYSGATSGCTLVSGSSISFRISLTRLFRWHTLTLRLVAACSVHNW